MSKPLTTTAYAAVRRTSDSGKEWIDLSTVECLLELAKTAASRINAECGPNWESSNPVIRFIGVTLTEEFGL